MGIYHFVCGPSCVSVLVSAPYHQAFGITLQVDLALEQAQQQQLEAFIKQDGMGEAFDLVKNTYLKVRQYPFRKHSPQHTLLNQV